MNDRDRTRSARSHLVRDRAGWERLPGGEMIREGLRDLEASIETVPSLLVSIGAPRLRSLGIEVAEPAFTEPEHRLFLLLARENPDSALSI